jgi:hypothetical protein
MLNRCGWVLCLFYPEGEAGRKTEVISLKGGGNSELRRKNVEAKAGGDVPSTF